MATTKETKAETKKTTENKKSPQAKETPLPQEQDNLPPLPYKTCSLRVSIHCEGCKRKVKKILTSIEGVYKVDIDVKEQKVTVIGIVEPEILTKKLLKAGKLAEIIPEKPDPVETKPEKPDPNNGEKRKTKKKKKEEKSQITDEGGNNAGCCGGAKPETGKIGGEGGEVVKSQTGEGAGKTGDPVKDKKTEDKETVTEVSGDKSPATDKTGDAKKAEAGKDGRSGSVCKKKKKKVQKGDKPENSTDTLARTGSLPPTVPPANQDRPSNPIEGDQMITNTIPPRSHMYPYPPSYYAPPPQHPPVVYGVSYNMSQPPASVYGASYYTSPYSYSYMHPGFTPSDQNPYPSRPSDSFELFSDENPNGCSVM